MARTQRPTKRLKTDKSSAEAELNPLLNTDVLVSIAPYLSAEELVDIAMTSRYFGGIVEDGSTCLIEEVARQVMINDPTDEEKAMLPKYEHESHLQHYHQLVLLRSPLYFDQLVGTNLQYVNSKDKSKVHVIKSNNSTKSAISNFVMRAGKHYVEFPNESGRGFFSANETGIMRPIKGWHRKREKKTKTKSELVNHFNPTWLKKAFSIELLGGKNERWGESNVHACMLTAGRGLCHWSNWEQHGRGHEGGLLQWDGQENFSSLGRLFGGIGSNGSLLPPSPRRDGPPTRGMLLDLDEGTLSVYKNGRRLGVMMSGLTGEYVWVVSIGRSSTASIRRAPIPVDE